MTEYKIRNLKTGLFSKGGDMPLWGKTGKTWRKLTDLKRHLSRLIDGPYANAYHGCELVVFEVTRVEGPPALMDGVMTAVIEEQTDYWRRWDDDAAKRKVKRLEAELAKAKEELASRA